MKVVFMGTPDFAVPSLQKLIENNYEIQAVFTQPDKPKGRGHKLCFSPVKELALEYNLPVYQPTTLRTQDIAEQIKSLKPDFIIVAAYGKILPKSILEIPEYGCINVHGSLLPKYRGAAPIQHAVLNGDKVTGITTMYMGEGLDTGDILLKEEVQIGEDETSEELFDRMKVVGADLLIKTLQGLVSGEVSPVPQDDALSTYASVITKDLSPIDWSLENYVIHNKVRGLNSWPCAESLYKGKKIKIHRTVIADADGSAGKLYCKDKKLYVYCGKGSLEILELQLENGKRMSGSAFLLGHPLTDDVILGE